MKYLSVCSGMEAATVAWHPLGWEPVGFSEIEPFPCAILKHRFPNTQNYGSLTEYQSWPLEPGTVDLLVGGTPCQSFSVAGLRKGMQDPRGNLALTFLGLADRLRPRWIVWENVPGVLSSNGGRDFGAFLGALGQLGYGWAYRVLDAQHFGVPQRRRRVFVVATSSGDGRLAGEVLSLPEGLRGYLEARRKKGQGVASGPAGGVDADGAVLWNGSDQPNAERVIDKAGTLNCNQGQRGGYICPANPSHWDGGPHPTLNQSAKGSGGVGSSNQEVFSQRGAYLVPGKPVIIDRAAFNQGENALYDPVIEETDTCPTIIQRGPHAVQPPIPFRKAKRAQSDKDDESWVEGEVSNTLNNFDLGDTRTTHAVVEPIPIQDGREIEKKQNGIGIGQPGDPAYTIDTTGAQAAGVVAIQGTIIGRGENAGPQGTGATEGGPMFTLTKTDIHGVAHSIPIQDGREIDKKQNRMGIGQPGDPSYTIDTTSAQSVAHCSDVAPTVTSSGPPYSRTGNERVEAEALVTGPITFQPGNLRREAGADPSTEATTTLKATPGDQMPHVAYPVGTDCYNGAITGDVAATMGTPGSSVNASGPTVMQHMAVRRLTPIECERLQGFPDNWSRIPWKGKPEEDCPDGPRYKACGNSMAVPVMRWIGTRIAEVEARQSAKPQA